MNLYFFIVGWDLEDQPPIYFIQLPEPQKNTCFDQPFSPGPWWVAHDPKPRRKQPLLLISINLKPLKPATTSCPTKNCYEFRVLLVVKTTHVLISHGVFLWFFQNFQFSRFLLELQAAMSSVTNTWVTPCPASKVQHLPRLGRVHHGEGTSPMPTGPEGP